MSNINLYIIKANTSYKIGVTKDIKKRITGIKTGCMYPIEVIGYYKGEFATKKENELHRLFKLKRLKGEWFNLNEDDLLKIEALLYKNDFKKIPFELNQTKKIGRPKGTTQKVTRNKRLEIKTTKENNDYIKELIKLNKKKHGIKNSDEVIIEALKNYFERLC